MLGPVILLMCVAALQAAPYSSRYRALVPNHGGSFGAPWHGEMNNMAAITWPHRRAVPNMRRPGAGEAVWGGEYLYKQPYQGESFGPMKRSGPVVLNFPTEILDLLQVDPALAELKSRQGVDPALAELKSRQGVDPALAELNARQGVDPVLAELKSLLQVDPALAELNARQGVDPELAELKSRQGVDPELAELKSRQDTPNSKSDNMWRSVQKMSAMEPVLRKLNRNGLVTLNMIEEILSGHQTRESA